MKPPNQFVAIVDKNGDIWDFIPKGSSMQNIKSVVERNDRNRPWGSPHSALLWNGAVWYPFHI